MNILEKILNIYGYRASFRGGGSYGGSMLKKMEKPITYLKDAGRRKNLAAVFICLNLILLSCVCVFFSINLHTAFLKEKESRIFGAVFPDTADDYYREILMQIETNIQAEGDLLLSRDCGYDIELQGRQMLELADRGAEAVFVCPAADRGLEEEIRRCMQCGTRVILVGRGCAGEEEAQALVLSDDEKAGETLAGYIDVKVKLARILLLGREKDSSSRARTESFCRRILGDKIEKSPLPGGESAKTNDKDDNADSSTDKKADSNKDDNTGSSHDPFQIVRRVQVENGEKEMEKARSYIGRELQRGRKFDLIFAADEKLAAGAYAALREAGEEKHVQIVAVDGSPVGKRMLRSSGYLATVMEYPSVLAGEAVRQAYSELEMPPGSRILTQVKLVTKNIIYSYDIDKWE